MLLSESRGERFCTARNNAGYTMDKVSIDTGISKSMIQALEDDDNNRDVGYSHIIKLATFYGVSTDYLLGLSDEPSPKIELQAIIKATGLSEKTIRNLKSILNVGDDPISEYMPTDHRIINLFLQHSRLRKFISDIHEAIRYSARKIPIKTTTEDMKNAENAAYSLGGKMLMNFEATQYYRQEAMNALRDIVYDLVPDEKEEG